MRHGPAQLSHPAGDRARQLTKEGQVVVKKVAEQLVLERPPIARIVSSPYPRAMATGAVVAYALNHFVGPSVANHLFGGDPEQVSAEVQKELDRFATPTEAFMIIGHMPTIATYLRWLVRADLPTPDAFQPAGVALVSCPHGLVPGKGELLAFRNPADWA